MSRNTVAWEKLELVASPLIGALIGGLASSATYLNLPPASRDFRLVLYTSGAGLIVGLLTDLYLAMLHRHEGKLKGLSENIDQASIRITNIQREVHSLSIRTNNYLTFYEHIREMLSSDKFSTELARIILKYGIDHFWEIPYVSRAQYCNYLEQGATLCETWEGIHEGSIKEFSSPSAGIDYNYLYLLNQNDGNIKVRRRIIIVGSQRRLNEELGEKATLGDFWRCTGEKVRSYCVTRDVVTKLTGFKGAFHDCALHDSVLLLHYNREEGRIMFAVAGGHDKDGRAAAVKELFAALDRYRGQGPFSEITESLVRVTGGGRVVDGSVPATSAPLSPPPDETV
jgi:hypothetical protein